MFKKSFLSLMAVVALFATSCQKEAFVEEPLVAEEATVSFNIGTPDIATRAYSDGSTATQLQYAVYDAAGNILNDLTETDATINGSTTVNLQLTTGNTYYVIFWAAAPNAPYTVGFGTTLAEANMTVDYTNAVSNDENRDAFYVLDTVVVKGAQAENVQLRRPFAQLNIGTNDLEESAEAGYEPTVSKVVVDAYSELNFSTGNVIGDADTVTFDYADLPTGERFPVTGYDYLAMNYLLMPTDQETVDVEFSYKNAAGDEKTRTIGSVPVRRNYRTNLYGQILTSNVEINVEIKPEFDGSLEAALQTAATFGGEVTLTEDVELPKTLVVADDVTMVINLNGHDIINNSGKTDLEVGDGIIVYGNLTINGEGTVQGATRAVWARGDKGAKVTINGGNYVGAVAAACEVVYASGDGEIDIYGGTFEAKTEDTESFAAPQYAVLNLHGNGAAGCNITVYGGKFIKFDPANNVSENPYKNFVADGYVSTYDASQDAYVVTENKEFEVYNNDDLTKALADPSVTVISIKSNLDFGTSGVTINRNVVIKGNGSSFRAGGITSKSYAFIIKGANVEINDLVVNSDSKKECGGIHISENSVVVVNNISMNVRNAKSRHMFYVNNSSLTVNSNNEKFTMLYSGNCVMMENNAKVIINGGEWKHYDASRTIGATDDKSTAEITGGIFAFNPNNWVADGYQAVQNGSKWEVVTK